MSLVLGWWNSEENLFFCFCSLLRSVASQPPKTNVIRYLRAFSPIRVAFDFRLSVIVYVGYWTMNITEVTTKKMKAKFGINHTGMWYTIVCMGNIICIVVPMSMCTHKSNCSRVSKNKWIKKKTTRHRHDIRERLKIDKGLKHSDVK